MNKVFLIGNLTKDPEIQTSTNGVAVCKFTLAVQRKFADVNGEKQTDFIPIVAWRKVAELCGNYLAKGSKVCVCGSLQIRSYDANDGTKRYVTEIIADEVEFLSKNNVEQTQQQVQASQTKIEPIDDDNLPF